ncbi:hypothetical protein GGR52DRAFT_534678 [Hypoxylon sp. FL1284]|nr:hypothetical protein GGR52DRAFT_534678 [Hypoxylon sp. FL1284]
MDSVNNNSIGLGAIRSPDDLTSDDLPFVWHPTAGNTVEEKAQIVIEHHQQSGLPLYRLWLEVNATINRLGPDGLYMPYLNQLCKLVSCTIANELAQEGLGTGDLSQALAAGRFTLPAHDGEGEVATHFKVDEDGSPKFNPEATVFAPRMTTPTKATPRPASAQAAMTDAQADVTDAQAFQERCQKFGLRISSAPAAESATSATKPAPTNFEERCKKNGLRISSSQGV